MNSLLSDLGPVVAGAPTRERLVGQFMTALFNAGRQAEALQVYAQTRHVLADELGVDPSRELRQVMEQILRHDAALVPADPISAGVQAGCCRLTTCLRRGNLPFRSTSFVGRDLDVRRAVDQLTRARLVTLAGPGGAGKTALAIEAARAAAPRLLMEFGWSSWRRSPRSEGIVHAVADAVGMGISGGTAIQRPVDLLIGQLASKNLLLVMDNCEHLIEPVAVFVETLLARCPYVSVLATSREALAVER